MLKKVIISSLVIVSFVALAIFVIQGLKVILFSEVPWVLGITILLGLVSFIVRLKLKKSPVPNENANKGERHNIDSFLEHWGTGIGILLSIYSGFTIKGHPGFFSANLHFVSVNVILFFGSYFLADFFAAKKYNALLPSYEDIVHGTLKKYLIKTPWQETGKYLSSQKSALLAFSFLGIGIILTGILKLTLFSGATSPEISVMSTLIHDFLAASFIVMFVIHMFLVTVIRSHRRFIKSWFTGISPVRQEKVEQIRFPELPVECPLLKDITILLDNIGQLRYQPEPIENTNAMHEEEINIYIED